MNSSQSKYDLPLYAWNQILEIIEEYGNVERVILYGSRAKGNCHAASDIDLCLEGENLTLKDLLAIENQLDDLLLPWKIDLSLKHKIESLDLLAHIERVGVTIKC